ncbi:restriction endonuclease subunit S [Agathobacter rectalis]|uniref:restriction endonuclease subunit S n=1 Tax=Agathobacter rectalis TaxID=39491 RepID=UPI0027D216AB|nr:restriction endonuclease subunit S [Agathobacter rectalis]MDB8013556.1 restriction endonuclease subunit S [Agathobacter rectalis]
MRKKLKDVCMFYSGTGFPIQYQGQTKGEYPFYKVGDIANNAIAGKIYLELCNNYISSDVAKMIKGCILPKDTVVFAKIGEALKLNRRAITSCDCLIDNNAMGIAPKLDSLRIQYFYFCMKNLKMQTLAESTTVPSVRKTVLEKYEIEVPSLVEQEEIEKKLTLTQKIIEKRRQELSYLDEIIKARFVEMFGDPVKNPKGWEVVTIGDIVTEVRYGTSKPAVEGGKYPYLRMNNLTADGHLDLNDLKYIDIPDDEIEKCVVRKGDVLFNRTNSIELVGKTVVFDLQEDMIIAGYIIRVRLNKRLLPEILSQYMNLEALKDILRSMAKGAVNQANINAQELQSIKVYIPDMELQKQFIEMKNQVDKSKVAVQKALDETQILFDSLMQKYFG